MRKLSVIALGLLCLTGEGASSQTFERQVLQISQTMSAAALQMRRNMAESGLNKRISIPASNPLDALDEAAVGVAAKFVSIAPGKFKMGSPADEEERDSDEDQRRVELEGFEMQATAVTQLQYFLVTGRNPSAFRKEGNCDKDNYKAIHGRSLCVNHPVETVSWNDAQKFVEELNRIQDKCAYDLPTEAQWEYAARGGMPSGFPYSFGFNDTNELDNHAWHSGNSNSRTHAVATKKANPWGLYDMHGDVWEWVLDRDNNHSRFGGIYPIGPEIGVVRGGSWSCGAGDLRSANRHYDFSSNPSGRWNDVGFRLVRSCR